MVAAKACKRLVKRKGKGGWNGCLVENVGMCGGRLEEGGSCRIDVAEQGREIDEGPGDNGVRHPRGRARGYRDPRDNGVPPETAGIVERDIRRHKQPIRQRSEKGQSTVEFAVITAGFIAATVALSALWHAFGDGLLVEHALAVASHHVQSVAPVAVGDIFLY